MKYFLFILMILFLNKAIGQIQENFTDGDFVNNPSWSGDTAHFKINSSFQLQLNSTGTDTSILSTSNQLILNTEWEFYIKLTFNTSSNNFARVYLTSDQPQLYSNLNGYFVQIGSTQDDIGLYRQDGNQLTLLIASPAGITSATSNEIKIKVLRQNNGQWELNADPTNGMVYQNYGAVVDTTYQTSNYFGVFCKYTTTNSQRFYFDNIKVQHIQVDSFAPIINKISIISSKEIDLLFNEPVDSSTASNINNYQINNNIGKPIKAERNQFNPGLVRLTFGTDFKLATQYLLTVDYIEDLLGNVMQQQQLNFTYYRPQLGDVLINEIMADPSPVVALPEAEFIELFNNTNFDLSLNSWQFIIGTKINILPDTIIKANDYIIICDDDFESNFKPFGKTIGLASLSLVNGGSQLILKDDFGQMVHQINYNSNWYGQTSKADGGWSLEQIDPNNPCGGANNWWASNNAKGGTPGQKNSIFGQKPDISAPEIQRIAVIDSLTIFVSFTESLDSASLFNKMAYLIRDSIGNPINIISNYPNYNSVQLKLAKPLQKSIIYKLQMMDTLMDCVGNLLAINTTKAFGIAEKPEKFDLIINEVLFDPKTNGVDFVEIYNRSSKIIDLNGLKLANYDYSSLDFKNISSISSEPLALFPSDYLVLTTSSDIVRKEYLCKNPYNFVEMASFPSLTNTDGNVFIISPSQLVIDSMEYTDDMHFKLLKSYDGVSLERINFDVSSTNNKWFSASAAVGYATPTYINSQFSASGQSKGNITVVPEIFSPDNDGFDDVIALKYALPVGTIISKIIIYDAAGRIIKVLSDSQLAGSEGEMYWDGFDQNGQKAPIGIYVVISETINLDGGIQKFKNVFTLAGRL